MLSDCLGSDKYYILSHCFDSARVQTHDLAKRETDGELILPGQAISGYLLEGFDLNEYPSNTIISSLVYKIQLKISRVLNHLPPVTTTITLD